jgi:hypothetical protein
MRLHHWISLLVLGVPLVATAAPPRQDGTPNRSNGVSARTQLVTGGGVGITARAAQEPRRTVSTTDDLPLPREVVIGEVTGSVPSNRLRFPYRVRGGGKAGPVRLELALHSDARRNRLIDVQENVPLARSGSFEFRLGATSNVFGKVSCRRRCFLLLKVQRGSQERQIQMPLIPRTFARLVSRGQSRRSGQDGSLGDFAVSFRGFFTRPGDPLGKVNVEVEALASRQVPSRVRGVRADLVFRDRRGERVIASLNQFTISFGRRSFELDPKGFVVPETGGSFEVRLTKGLTQLAATGDLVPRSFRVGSSARVRDRRRR